MPVVKVPAELTVDHLVRAVEQLPSEELAEFARRVIAIQVRRGVPLLVNDEEQALLAAISGRLPTEVQRRLDELREKSYEETLTPVEQAELLAFVQQVEQRDVARAEALVQLAKKRGTTVSELMHTLGLGAAANA
jgi:alkylhydroperoxidase/carboxymuconolactone decarboxylase family protein YurZ